MKLHYKSSLLTRYICTSLRNGANVKLIYALLFIFFAIVNQRVLAQEEKSVTDLIISASPEDKSKLSVGSMSKLTKIEQSKRYKQVQLVKVGNLAKIQKKGVLTFTVPGLGETFTYFAQKVVAQSELDFTWIGVSADKLSTAIFICKQGKLSGTFGINGRGFQLSPTDGGLSVLIEDRNDLNLNCEVEGSAYLNKESTFGRVPTPQHAGAREGVCTEPIRVLVLYTQNALNNAPQDINTVIEQAIQQYNTAVNNSGISSGSQTNFVQEAARQFITFPSGSDPETATTAGEAAGRVRDNPTVQSLRDQYQADVVVCLVSHTYSNGAVGSTNTVPASKTEYAAIVGVEYASSVLYYSFAHEVGHFVGGRHENDTNGPAYSHGYQFTTNSGTQVRTMMYRSVPGVTRILHFSNPLVTFDGTPTGTFDQNYVAKRITEVSPDVVNFRPSTTKPFNAIIDGPDNITQSNFYNWVLLTFCRGYSTTEWRFSTDGFNYGPPVGAGDAVNNYFVDNSQNGTLYLKCTVVTDQGNTYVTTKTITVNIGSGGRLAATNARPDVRVNEVASIFPNPADKKVTFNYVLQEYTDVDVEFVDLIGRTTRMKSMKNVPSGNHTEELDVSQLTNGLYVCRFKLGSRIINKPFIVSK